MLSVHFHLLLLSLALYVCHARHLEVTDKQFSGKKLQISTPVRIERHVTNGEAAMRRVMKGRSIAMANEKKKHRTSILVSVQMTESSNTVSWSLPRKKHEQEKPERPGFDLDYEPPKAHPPIHN